MRERVAVDAERDIRSERQPGRSPSVGPWVAATAIGVSSIWIAVAAISVFAPDMVSGSEHQHLPIAALTTWLWGGIATPFFLMTMFGLRRSAAWRPIWVGLGVTTVAVWTGTTIVAIASPVVVTGSDPTQIPLGAILAPIGAMVVTTLASVVANLMRVGDGP